MTEVEQKKSIQKILWVVLLNGLSVGLWGTFKLLWIESNHIDTATISRMISLGSLLSCIGIWFISMKIHRDKIKKLTLMSLLVKLLCLLVLFLGNQQLTEKLIAFFVIVDIMMDAMITASIYPLMTCIKKDDKDFGKKNVIRYIAEDLGIFIGGVLVGRTIGSLPFHYNTFLCMSIFLLIGSLLLLFQVQIPKNRTQEGSQTTKQFLNYLKNQPVLRNYLGCCFLSYLSWSIVFDLQILILTNLLSFSVTSATFFDLLTNLAADGLGLLFLKCYTPKKEKNAILFKYGLRVIIYTFVFLLNKNIFFLVAFIFVDLLSALFEDQMDGSYVNLVEDRYQLMFSNLTDITNRFGSAVGVFFAGILLPYGLRIIMLAGAITSLFLVILRFRTNYLKEKKQVLE